MPKRFSEAFFPELTFPNPVREAARDSFPVEYADHLDEALAWASRVHRASARVINLTPVEVTEPARSYIRDYA